MHPWIDDPQQELDRLKKQKEEEQAELEQQYSPFGQPNSQSSNDESSDINEE